METKRRQRSYDHRLALRVHEAGDAAIATRLGVPRSTAAGWLRHARRAPTIESPAEEAVAALQRRVGRLERRCRRQAAVLRLLFVLMRVLKPDLSRVRFAGLDKARLLRAVDRTRGILGLQRVLSVLGLSASRFHAWKRAAQSCQLEDQPSCPRSSPQRLTPPEVMTMRRMAVSDDLRHVPTGRLALLAQREGAVCASPSTWLRFVKERGWRRPRARVYPRQPTEGIRAERPNQVWHIDTTIVKLLDGTRAYLHAVIDNYSRRILAWRLADRFTPGSSVAVLLEAGRALEGFVKPTLLADSGVENVNADVDELIESGLLRRVLAQTEVCFSNSIIEAWWRSLKHGWLYLNTLDTFSRLRSLIEFYVAEHNTRLPHSAFDGQTPDEMYRGTGSTVPETLAARREEARQRRLAANRASRCPTCVSCA